MPAVSTCETCAHTGYKGRTGIYQFMPMTEELRGLVIARAPLDEIRAAAVRDGMQSLYEDGMRQVAMGITTSTEVLRVTSEDAGA